MTKIVLCTARGKIPLKELVIHEIGENTLSLSATSEGGVGLHIGLYIKTEL